MECSVFCISEVRNKRKWKMQSTIIVLILLFISLMNIVIISHHIFVFARCAHFQVLDSRLMVLKDFGENVFRPYTFSHTPQKI